MQRFNQQLVRVLHLRLHRSEDGYHGDGFLHGKLRWNTLPVFVRHHRHRDGVWLDDLHEYLGCRSGRQGGLLEPHAEALQDILQHGLLNWDVVLKTRMRNQSP
jgi:hypothetical protein